MYALRILCIYSIIHAYTSTLRTMYRYYIYIYIVYTRGGHYDEPLKSAEVLTTTVILLCSVIFINRTSSSSVSYNLCAAFLSPFGSSHPSAHYRRSVIVVIITTRVAFVVSRFPLTWTILLYIYIYYTVMWFSSAADNRKPEHGRRLRRWRSAEGAPRCTIISYIQIYNIYLMLIYYVVFPCQFFSTRRYHPFINILYISTIALVKLVKLFFIPSPRHLSTILLN